VRTVPLEAYVHERKRSRFTSACYS